MDVISPTTYKKLVGFRKKRNAFAHQSVCNQNLFECGNKLEKKFVGEGEKVRKIGVELLDEICGMLLKTHKKLDKVLTYNSGIVEQLYERDGKLKKSKTKNN